VQFKVDFHTHSEASPDGALSAIDYRRALEKNKLDCIAVTDHNDISMAKKMHEAFGERIIIGEEITTLEGEIIGLFLKEVVRPHMSAIETVKAIHKQGGLVYVPHPFETVRSGLTLESLDRIAGEVDIIEIHNGRAVFQDKSQKALDWAASHNVVGAASSDAHGVSGWGKTFTLLAEMPTRKTLLELLKEATFKRGFPGVRGISYPKYNRLRKKLTHVK
jgi:predicted metal-dependent phosphoesterase TrpH